MAFAVAAGGGIGLIAAFALIGPGSIVAILVGTWMYRPAVRWPWWCYATALTLFIIAGVIRGLEAAVVDAARYPSDAEWLEAVALSSMVAATYGFVRVRRRHRDPTNVLDSIILTGGPTVLTSVFVLVPFIESEAFSVVGQLTGLLFGNLVLVFGILTSYLVLTSARTVALRLLVSSSSGAAATFLVFLASLGREIPATLHVVEVLLAQASFVLVAAAALHPGMVELTRPAVDQPPAISSQRVWGMGATAVLPPMVLLAVNGRSSSLTIAVLAASWAALTMLVLVRVFSLVRARERLVTKDRVLRDAGASVAGASHQKDMYQAMLAAALDLLGTKGSARASLIRPLADASCSHVVASIGVRPAWQWEQLTGVPHVGPNDMATVEHDVAALDRPSEIWQNQIVVPLLTGGEVLGQLMVVADRLPSTDIIEGLQELAIDTAAALRAAELRTELARRRVERRFHLLIENTEDLIVVIQGDRTTFVSPAGLRLLGQTSKSLMAKSFVELFVREDQAGLQELLQQPTNRSPVQARMEVAGQMIWLELIAIDLTSESDIGGIVVTGRDITAQRSLEEDLRHRAFHDLLTGVGNRAYVQERLEWALALPGKPDVGVIVLDLDDFKEINDGLGHFVGDRLLVEVAARIEAQLTGDASVARFGGDEFAVVVPRCGCRDQLIELGHRIFHAIAQPFSSDGHEWTVGASVGMTLASDVAHPTPDHLMRAADLAMYSAKKRGKAGISMFEPAMETGAVDRLALRADIHTALDNEEFEVCYQPIVRSADCLITGFEALLRWNHPVRGRVNPTAFIPIAEETGLIVPIGRWVFEQAMTQLADWQLRYDRGLTMSVNISPRQLECDDLIDHLTQVVETQGIDPTSVIIELTESMFVHRSGAQANRLGQLRTLGFGLHADDFGSGYASYAALQQLPFTGVKIDGSLIEGLANAEDRRARAQVTSMLDMAEKSGMSVVAEGVETCDQLAVLDSLSCPLVQGFYFAAAELPDSIESYLAKWCHRTHIDLTLVDTDYEHDPVYPDHADVEMLPVSRLPVRLAPAAGT